MKVVCIKNGIEVIVDNNNELDFIEYDVVKDQIKEINYLENNPNAKIEIDLSKPDCPIYNLINCNANFENKFHDIITEKNFVL